MNSVLIQFHSTVEELVEFVQSVSSDFGLVIVLMTLKPFRVEEVSGELDLLKIQEALINTDVRLVLLSESASMGASNSDEFLKKNSGSIEFDVGRSTDNSLNESALSFMSDDEAAYSIAKKIATRLKKITKAGVIAVNPDSGAEAKIRTHRYTKGAKLKYDEGFKILPVAGKSLLKLPD